MSRELSPVRLLVRCLAQKQDEQWEAYSLEFGLAAQAESFSEAKQKLDAMIQDYLHDALTGEDREHAGQLLSRKAPWWVYAKYFCVRAVSFFDGSAKPHGVKIFDEPWGVEPKRLAA